MPNLPSGIFPAGETRGKAAPPALRRSGDFPGSSFPPGKQQRGPSPRGEARRQRQAVAGCPRARERPAAAGSPREPQGAPESRREPPGAAGSPREPRGARPPLGASALPRTLLARRLLRPPGSGDRAKRRKEIKFSGAAPELKGALEGFCHRR